MSPQFVFLLALIIFAMLLHGTNATRNRGNAILQVEKNLQARAVRNADYMANGPLPKAWDATNNKTMESAPIDAAPKTPRSLEYDGSVLKARSNIVERSPYTPASKNPQRRATDTAGIRSRRTRDVVASQAEDGDLPASHGGKHSRL